MTITTLSARKNRGCRGVGCVQTTLQGATVVRRLIPLVLLRAHSYHYLRDYFRNMVPGIPHHTCPNNLPLYAGPTKGECCWLLPVMLLVLPVLLCCRICSSLAECRTKWILAVSHAGGWGGYPRSSPPDVCRTNFFVRTLYFFCHLSCFLVVYGVIFTHGPRCLALNINTMAWLCHDHASPFFVALARNRQLQHAVARQPANAVFVFLGADIAALVPSQNSSESFIRTALLILPRSCERF